MSNPEFRRYVWLELSQHRLVAVPALLLVVVAVVVSSLSNAAEVLTKLSLSGFALFTACYGSKRAFDSVGEEVQTHTWDFQRMSALSPWSLAIGKVLGAPVFAWYTGAWLLVIFAFSGLSQGFPNLGMTLIGAVAATVLVHALAVALSAASARAGLGRRSRGVGVVLGLIALLNLWPELLRVFRSGSHGDPSDVPRVIFFSFWNMSMTTYEALSSVVFAAWALLAAWRMMARELREPPWWAVWPAFALFTGVWVWGTSAPGQTALATDWAFLLAALILIVAAYSGLVMNPLGAVAKTRFMRARQATPPLSWDKQLPQWVIHIGIAGLLALVAVALAAPVPRPNDGLSPRLGATDALGLSVVLPLVLMFIRDAAIVSCFTLVASRKRPLATAVFYIAVLDILAPMLLMAMGLRWPTAFCLPLLGPGLGRWVPVGFMAIHAALALAVLRYRWRR